MFSFSLMSAPNLGSATPSSTPPFGTCFFKNFFSCLLSFDSTKSDAAATASVVSRNGAKVLRERAFLGSGSLSFDANLSASNFLSFSSCLSSYKCVARGGLEEEEHCALRCALRWPRRRACRAASGFAPPRAGGAVSRRLGRLPLSLFHARRAFGKAVLGVAGVAIELTPRAIAASEGRRSAQQGQKAASLSVKF